MNPVLLNRTENITNILINLTNGANNHKINNLLCKIRICVAENEEGLLIRQLNNAESYACEVVTSRVYRR